MAWACWSAVEEASTAPGDLPPPENAPGAGAGPPAPAPAARPAPSSFVPNLAGPASSGATERLDEVELRDFLRNIDAFLAAAKEREQDRRWEQAARGRPAGEPAGEGGPPDVHVWLEGSDVLADTQDVLEWWDGLRELHVLLFSGEDIWGGLEGGWSEEDTPWQEGIFSLYDYDASGGQQSFIVGFECAQEAEAYADRLADVMGGWRTEVDALEPADLAEVCADLDSGLRIVAQGQEPPSLRDLDLDSSALDLRALAMEREMADLELRSLREKLENCLPPGDGEDAEDADGGVDFPPGQWD